MAQAYPTKGIRKFLYDLFTGPDGEHWAIGRVYSFPVLITGLATPIVMIFRQQPVDLIAFGTLLAGIGGACVLLIRFNNGVDNQQETSANAPPEATPQSGLPAPKP